MLKHFYKIIDKETGFSLDYYYYTKTKAEQIAKEMNKNFFKSYGNLFYPHAITKKIK